jgi:hypothetical protein
MVKIYCYKQKGGFMNSSLKIVLIISSILSFLTLNACNTNTPKSADLRMVKINEIPTKFVANPGVNSSTSNPDTNPSLSVYNNSQSYNDNPNNAPSWYDRNTNNARGGNYNQGNVSGNYNERVNSQQYNQNIQSYPIGSNFENKQYNSNDYNNGVTNSY